MMSTVQNGPIPTSTTLIGPKSKSVGFNTSSGNYAKQFVLFNPQT